VLSIHKKTFAQPRKAGLTVEEAQLCLEVGVWADLYTSLRSATVLSFIKNKIYWLEGKKQTFGGQK
jgi:hypothetical protein